LLYLTNFFDLPGIRTQTDHQQSHLQVSSC